MPNMITPMYLGHAIITPPSAFILWIATDTPAHIPLQNTNAYLTNIKTERNIK